MAIFDIDAITADVDWDLDDTLASGAYRIQYSKVNGSFQWDSTYYDSIGLYRGQVDPDLVRIRLTDPLGIQEEVMLGIVDRSGRQRDGGNGVVGSIAGRDLLALVLDKYPTTATTLQGVTIYQADPYVSSDATIVPVTNFTDALTELVGLAGLGGVLFDLGGDDYPIGRSIPVTTDRTYGEVLADLLTPWRWSEKHRADVWVEGDVLRIARRGLNARGTVNVEYEMLTVHRYEKTVKPAGDVRVEGATYEVLVPSHDQPPGTDDDIRVTTNHVTGPTARASYTETLIEYYTDDKLEHTVRQRSYDDFLRFETWVANSTFIRDPSSEADGNKDTETETHTVADNRSGENPWYPLQKTVSTKNAKWNYYSDTGDTQSADVTETEYDESAEDELQLPIKDFRVSNQHYSRSVTQVVRQSQTSEFDPDSGALRTQFGLPEVAPFRGRGALGIERPGTRREQRKFSAGPETAHLKFSSELLGSDAACLLIHGRLVDEFAGTRLGISITLPADFRIKHGMALQVLNAPAWWDASNFLITASRIHSAHDGLMMDLEGVAWL